MDNEISIDGYMIERKSNSNSPLDYDNLRALGIKFTQEFSGDTWTDYNLHDPGITILESLCYAITDLAYRTKFNLEDLLTSGDGIIDGEKNYFFSARDVLSTNPVTDKDFRKLVINHFPEIENVWFEPILPQVPVTYCKGFYRVIIQYNYLAKPGLTKKNVTIEDNERDLILKAIQQFINEYRNIGEDFEEFTFLEPVDIVINAGILVAENELPEKILTEVYAVIYRTLNPYIHFYSEAEMKQMGVRSEELNLGPVLSKGFVKDEFLNLRARSLDPLDLVKAVAGINGVVQVKDLTIKIGDKIYDREIYDINNDQFLYFNYESTAHNIQLYHENFKIVVKKEQYINKLKIKLDHFITGKENPGKQQVDNKSNPAVAAGKFRNLDNYVSVQQFFPEIYKLKTGLNELEKNKKSGTDAEIAGIKQLKAYLMLFEQVMVNYLAQLSNLDNLFSAAIDEKNMHTYFSQAVFNIPGAEKIINDFYDGKTEFNEQAWNIFKKTKENEYSKFLKRKIESDTVFFNRKNRLFDHVLSRFNVNLNVYPLKLYRELYDKHVIEGRLPRVLLWKKNLLDNIIPLLKNRSQGYNYSQQPDEQRMGGFQQLMQHLLYIRLHKDIEIKTDNNFELKRLYPDLKKGAGMELGKVNDTEPKQQSQPATENDEKIKIDGLLFFRNVNTRIFRFGIDRANYRIDRDKGNIEAGDSKEVYLLRYNSSKNDTWIVVGRFSDFYAALRARNEFINYLRKINIESEGFHLVEHILLIPPLHLPNFRFKVFNEKKDLQFIQTEWISFESRNKNISKLVNYDKSQLKGEKLLRDFENTIEGVCKLAIKHSRGPVKFIQASMVGLKLISLTHTKYGEGPVEYIRPSLLRQVYKNRKKELQIKYEKLGKNIKDIAENPVSGYAKIKATVLRNNNNKEEIAEDFFNLRATVVLPSWPARFQDSSFRGFIKRLFIENCPAHIRLDFKWMALNEMKEFETQYFEWLSEINKNKFSSQALECADKMITWIYNSGDYK